MNESQAKAMNFVRRTAAANRPILRTLAALLTIAIWGCSCGSVASATTNPAAAERNRAALAEAKRNIEKNRKGDATIRIADAAGRPVRSARIRIRQLSHDFKFGFYLKLDDLAAQKLPLYEARFAKLFNYAVVGIYWDFVETDRGQENWSWFEKEVALARKNGMTVAAAPVLWGTNEAGTPRWLERDRDELGRTVERRIESALRRSNEISDWEIVNEPLAPKTDVFGQRLGDSYIDAAFQTARRTNPSSRLMINEFGVFGETARNRDRYFGLLEELMRRRVQIDVIGIQAHSNGEWFQPANVAEQLRRYGKLGKPLQISEFSVQTREYENRRMPLAISGGYRNGVWNDELQAEFYREFYTVAFADPNVEAIVTWGLDDERAWLPGIGLIDEADRPKPNYRALDQLINSEWRTELATVSSDTGTAGFRGFLGRYEVVVESGRKTIARIFELSRKNGNDWVIRL